MNKIEELIKAHITRYPKMEIADAVKLLYQNEFGGGHIIKDERQSLERLESELVSLAPDLTVPLFEDIGNGYVRLNLAAAKDQISAETLNRIFVKSSNAARGNMRSFYIKLSALHRPCQNGELPFEPGELYKYILEYEKKGCPPVGHSAAYKSAYVPAYRVVLREYAVYFKLFSVIDSVLSKKPRANVAIDGMSAVGKSTLGELLAGVYDANIIRTDDFFLPPELRTVERLGEPGGNIHYERFLSEVVEKLKKEKEFSYRAFDCSKSDYGETVTVRDRPLNIIEGVYCLRPEFRHVYDIKVFLSIDAKEQKNRIINRNGDRVYERFEREWIPLENRYFEVFDIPGICDLMFSYDTQNDDSNF
jgi:dephospho-CoA kinase